MGSADQVRGAQRWARSRVTGIFKLSGGSKRVPINAGAGDRVASAHHHHLVPSSDPSDRTNSNDRQQRAMCEGEEPDKAGLLTPSLPGRRREI
jgi:hypothetical protein